MTEQCKAVGKRLAANEPVAHLHSRTNLDSAVVATILVELAKASILLLPVVAGGYVVAWIVLAIRNAT